MSKKKALFIGFTVAVVAAAAVITFIVIRGSKQPHQLVPAEQLPNTVVIIPERD